MKVLQFPLSQCALCFCVLETRISEDHQNIRIIHPGYSITGEECKLNNTEIGVSIENYIFEL